MEGRQEPLKPAVSHKQRGKQSSTGTDKPDTNSMVSFLNLILPKHAHINKPQRDPETQTYFSVGRNIKYLQYKERREMKTGQRGLCGVTYDHEVLCP